ncbi:hypothetical protein JE952_002400 [Flavobacterium psychrophilum]|nr:hypothetical protein [Flavobacterium psychrophilum]
MSESNLIPLSTEKIVESIKTVYRNLSDKVLRENPLLFGLVEETPTIHISFCKKVPTDENYYKSDKTFYYLVSDCNQVIEVLKQLGIYREGAESTISSAYYKEVNSKSIPSYLVVTSFKPISPN